MLTHRHPPSHHPLAAVTVRPDRTSIRGGRQARIVGIMGNFRDLGLIHILGNRGLNGCQRLASLSLLFLMGPIDCLTPLPCTYSRLDPTSHSLYIYLSLPVFQSCSMVERGVSIAELGVLTKRFPIHKDCSKNKEMIKV